MKNGNGCHYLRSREILPTSPVRGENIVKSGTDFKSVPEKGRISAMRFIPKEGKFFDMFEELAGRIEAGGKLFLELAENGAYSESQAARLKEIEHEADVITHRTYEKMHTSFITPLDREDIRSLVNKMDSILDMTEAAPIISSTGKELAPRSSSRQDTQRDDRKGQNNHPRPQRYEKRPADPPDLRRDPHAGKRRRCGPEGDDGPPVRK
jgi:hypothetical protein